MHLETTSLRVRLVVLGAMIFAALGRPLFAEQAPPPPENDPLYMRVVATP